jgi:hypothetical protein
MSELDRVFDRLNQWRNLPAYQLERRVDIFFALYLDQVLSKVVGTPIDPRLVPEFPLKQEREAKSSDKVDYLAISRDRTRSFFVELKTDNASVNPQQYQYLLNAQKKGLLAKLEGLKAIVDQHKIKSARKKYFCLFKELAELDLVRLPEGLEERIYAPNSRGVFDLFGAIEVRDPCPTVEIVYVVPSSTDAPMGSSGEVIWITFEQFAACLEPSNDPLAQKFAEMLRLWARTTAGERAG